MQFKPYTGCLTTTTGTHLAGSCTCGFAMHAHTILTCCTGIVRKRLRNVSTEGPRIILVLLPVKFSQSGQTIMVIEPVTEEANSVTLPDVIQEPIPGVLD